MRVIALCASKGGAGKSTLSIHLAVQAERSGYTTALVDLDPQASSAHWADNRGDDPPDVTAAQPSRLPRILEALRAQGADLVVIDTPPSAEGAAHDAARVSNLVLVPTRPSALDLAAVRSTVVLAKVTGVKAVVVLNACPSRSPLVEEAVSAISAAGVEVAPIRVHQRQAFVVPMAAGRTALEAEPKGKAAEEIGALWAWMSRELGLPPKKTSRSSSKR